MRLASGDPGAAPLIDPDYWADPHDLEMSLRGLQMAREILQQPALKPYLQREVLPEMGHRRLFVAAPVQQLGQEQMRLGLLRPRVNPLGQQQAMFGAADGAGLVAAGHRDIGPGAAGGALQPAVAELGGDAQSQSTVDRGPVEPAASQGGAGQMPMRRSKLFFTATTIVDTCQ